MTQTPEEKKAYQDHYRLINREKLRATTAAKRATSKYKSQQRAWNLKKYGITPEVFAAMAEAQGYKCGACGSPDPGAHGNWHVDHDHKTDYIRALLCFKCNTTLGFANDDVGMLQKLIEYLGRHKNV